MTKRERRSFSKDFKEQGLLSKYAIAQFKPSKSTVNESETVNVLNRRFNQEKELTVIVSD